VGGEFEWRYEFMELGEIIGNRSGKKQFIA